MRSLKAKAPRPARKQSDLEPWPERFTEHLPAGGEIAVPLVELLVQKSTDPEATITALAILLGIVKGDPMNDFAVALRLAAYRPNYFEGSSELLPQKGKARR